MENEFITYIQALALKELGFDEPCLAKHDLKHILLRIEECKNQENAQEFDYILAPLYQQAFKFFREKHELYHSVYADKRADDLTLLYKVHVYRLDEELSEYSYRWAKTYEEAEQACLDKLIEICKNNGKETI